MSYARMKIKHPLDPPGGANPKSKPMHEPTVMYSAEFPEGKTFDFGSPGVEDQCVEDGFVDSPALINTEKPKDEPKKLKDKLKEKSE